MANTGPAAFTGVTLSDPLADVLDDATYNGDLAASIGSASLSRAERHLDRQPGRRGDRDDHLLGDDVRTGAGTAS